MNLARCAVLLVLLLTATPVGAQYGRADDLQPKTYTSPSGEFVLSVDPSQRSGAGKALYALKRNGTVVWSAEHPFTLWDAVLADDGTTGGYAYSRGYNYDGGARGQGDFVVAILDTGGKLRLAERTAREASRFLHRMPDPQADGLFIDAHNDRLVVRVVDPDVNAGVESWWTYHLSDGKSAGKSRPRELMHDPEAARWVIDARPVAQTPLTLVHWYRLASESDQWQTGARFTLVDLQSKPVWTLELPRDYTISDDEDAQEQLRNAIHEHGAILDTTQPSRFELRHVAAGERVTYAVARDADTPHGWKVTEVARTPYADSQSDANKPAQRAQVPEVALRRLGSIELEGVGRSASPIQAVADFQIDDRGRIGFLRHRAAELALVIVDHAGKPVREVVLPKRSPRGDGSTHAAWVIDDRWLVTISEDGREQKSSAFWVDIDTGRVTPLAKFSAPPIESLVGSRDGGFVALTRSQSRYTVEDALNAFDERGVKRWVVDAQHGDDTKLFSPEDIAVTATGEIVVLENIANKLKVYGRDGAHRTTLDLAEIWGRKPNYPSGIAADPGGGVVVHDFAGKPSIVHMALDGKIRGAFSPAYADGRAFDIRGNVKVAPDGRYWTSDGHALLRLDAHGVVDLVLGRAPDPENLGRVAALHVTAKGRIYAADARTAAVHVFDAGGKRQHVCRPNVDDYKGDLSLPSLTVTDAGDVFIERGLGKEDFLHYTPRGERAGVETVELEEVSQDWYSQPKSGNRWVLGYTNAYLVDGQGVTLRTLDRTADRQWLLQPGPAGVAPDGSIAIVSGGARPFLRSAESSPAVVTLFSATGAALRTWPAPTDLVTYRDVAFDGTRLVFLVTPDKSGRARSAVALDVLGKPLFRFTPPANRALASVFLVQTGADPELWTFDGEGTIDRYALP